MVEAKTSGKGSLMLGSNPAEFLDQNDLACCRMPSPTEGMSYSHSSIVDIGVRARTLTCSSRPESPGWRARQPAQCCIAEGGQTLKEVPRRVVLRHRPRSNARTRTSREHCYYP